MIKYNVWEPHLKDFLSSYSSKFYWTHPNFIGPGATNILLSFAKEKEKQNMFRPAEIGKGRLKKRESSIRSDTIYWIEDFTSKEGEIIQNIFDNLKKVLRNELYLPSRRFECHFAKYEPGSFYKLHEDRHQNKPGRLVTCVLYLTKSVDNSGNLILYDEELRPINIKPEPGRIVVFDSSLEHEVLVSNSDRWSLTGWIRDDLIPGLRF